MTKGTHLTSSLLLSAILLLVPTSLAQAQCLGGVPDGMVAPTEDCDDNNLIDGDGCDSTCNIDAGFSCARTVNFANLVNNDYPGSDASWTIASDNLSGTQTVNSTNPTVALFGEDAQRGTYALQMEVTTDADDDWLGLALGFESGDQTASTADWILIDWKQAAQSGTPNDTVAGMMMAHVLGAPNTSTHISHSLPQRECAVPGVSPCVTQLALANTLGSTGWSDNTSYDVHVTYRPDRLIIAIDGVTEFDVTPDDFPGQFAGNVFPDGEIGFYTLSQEQTFYTNLAPFGPSTCNETSIADDTIYVALNSGTTTIDVSTLFSDADDSFDPDSVFVVSGAAGATALDPTTGANAGEVELTPDDDSFEADYTITVRACDDNAIIPACDEATVTVNYSDDSDGDTVLDGEDLDDDNDGIPDADEPAGDFDLDGEPNFRDLDSDNDGIPDITEAGGTDSGDGTLGAITDANSDGLDDTIAASPLTPPNTDGADGADYLDRDSDDDGINDVEEAGGTDAGDGTVAGFTDSDGDGYDDTLSATPLSPDDADGDGQDDYRDMDDDNDGIPTLVEDQAGAGDSDGIPNHLDLDSDNDGIPDITEAGGTDSGDGTLGAITDANSDGLDDAIASSPLPMPATDGGNADYLDRDSDGDGINDVEEAGGSDEGDGTVAGFTDGDGDGYDDTLAGAPLIPGDHDGDGQDDYRDADDDNDGIPTAIENAAAAGDSDGVANHLDLDSDNDGIPDITEAGGTDSGDGTLGVITDANDDGLDDGIAASPLPLPATDGGDADYLDRDSDGDGIADVEEAGGTDSGDGTVSGFSDGDGDGYDDTLAATPLGPADTDGDGQDDYRDADDDNDGIPSITEDAAAAGDSDGVPNYLDLDSDNDGIPDVTEAGGTDAGDGTVGAITDANGNGLDDGLEASPLPVPNTDGAGADDYLDVDSDGDGINDVVEAGSIDAGDGTVSGFSDGNGDGYDDTLAATPLDPEDTDGDGQDNYQDADDDNDGIPTATENAEAAGDSDGVDNHLDLDSDNDGIPDVTEAGGSDSGDGTVGAITDANGNGLDDGLEASPLPLPNTDGAGAEDYLDLDSDGDGINDVVEAGGTDAGDGTVAGFTDNDGDGYDDGLASTPLDPADTDGDSQDDYQDADDDNDGIPTATENAAPAGDTDGVPNHLDLDSDNDGIPDVTEAGGSDSGDGTVGAITDANGNGLDDGLEASPLPLPNTDGAGAEDYLDLDSDGDGINDVVEAGGTDAGDGTVAGFTDNDGDGYDDSTAGAQLDPPDTDGDNVPDFQDLDDDNDGIPDLVEGDADTDGDGTPDYRDLDSDNDGIPDVTEAGGTDA
ncbi:MAG: hypothetical protein OXT09_14520, partial [Myxococcales bacterium]|nr:hypothetical protein [Myxococcales bacterium]